VSKLTSIACRISKKQIAWLLAALLVSTALVAQDTDQPSQEIINKRIEEIFKIALDRGTGTTVEGYSYNLGKVFPSVAEYAEIKKYGDRAIAHLAAFLGKNDDRAQLLAVLFLTEIGGSHVRKILSPVAEKSSSAFIRYKALRALEQYPWPDIAEVVRRMSMNDDSPGVKSRARELVEKNDKRESKQH